MLPKYHRPSAGKYTLRPSLCIALALTLVLIAVACVPTPFPPPTPQGNAHWLYFRNGLGSVAEAQNYYQAINAIPAKDTLTKWKAANGFNTPGEVRAIYYNANDLDLGRDMHCKETPPLQVACYVTNYGPKPGDPGFPNETIALNDAIAAANGTAGGAPFATVAMEWSMVSPNPTFYVYDQNGNLAPQAVLDSDGAKAVPQICLPCHGGTFNSTSHTVSGASFLPFDVFTFGYGSSPYALNDQQEPFRILNSLVLETQTSPTNSHSAIADLINHMYPAGVTTPLAPAVDTFVPMGWNDTPTHRDLYKTIVRPYCRTCHLAVSASYDWTSYAQFENLKGSIRNVVCDRRIMPHAEVTYNKFWATVLPMLYLQDPKTGLDFQPPCVTFTTPTP